MMETWWKLAGNPQPTEVGSGGNPISSWVGIQIQNAGLKFAVHRGNSLFCSWVYGMVYLYIYTCILLVYYWYTLWHDGIHYGIHYGILLVYTNKPLQGWSTFRSFVLFATNLRLACCKVEASMHWQSEGDYLCLINTKLSKTKKKGHQFDIRQNGNRLGTGWVMVWHGMTWYNMVWHHILWMCMLECPQSMFAVFGFGVFLVAATEIAYKLHGRIGNTSHMRQMRQIRS